MFCHYHCYISVDYPCLVMTFTEQKITTLDFTLLHIINEPLYRTM